MKQLKKRSLQESDLTTKYFIETGSLDVKVVHEHFSLTDIRAGETGYVPIPGVVMVFDLAGSSASIRQNGPHAFVDKFSTVFKGLTDIIYNHQGVVEKFPGDGISAHFLRKESDPHFYAAGNQAIKAAVEMKAFMERQGLGRTFRICMWTGEDTIAAIIGSKAHEELISIGHGVNVAHKIEKHVKAENCVFGMDSVVEICYKALFQGQTSTFSAFNLLDDGKYFQWHGVRA